MKQPSAMFKFRHHRNIMKALWGFTNSITMRSSGLIWKMNIITVDKCHVDTPTMMQHPHSLWYRKQTFRKISCKATHKICARLVPCHGLLSWWRHQMETFSASLAFVPGNHRSPVNSPHKGQCHGALIFSLICVWINDWVNNREDGEFRRHRDYYDVTVMGEVSTDVCHIDQDYPSGNGGII